MRLLSIMIKQFPGRAGIDFGPGLSLNLLKTANEKYCFS